MRRQGSGFGFVILLVVLAVIALIAMRNWKAVAPTALEIRKHNADRAKGKSSEPETYSPPSSRSASEDTWTPEPPVRPSLETMEQRTSDHTKAVTSAASEAN